jgi:hypothetical protein
MDSVGRGFNVKAHAGAVIREQPHDRRIVICDEHPRRLIVRLEFSHLSRTIVQVEWFDFASRSSHDIAPDPDCRNSLVSRRRDDRQTARHFNIDQTNTKLNIFSVVMHKRSAVAGYAC